jgi:hypothetical protein
MTGDRKRNASKSPGGKPSAKRLAELQVEDFEMEEKSSHDPATAEKEAKAKQRLKDQRAAKKIRTERVYAAAGKLASILSEYSKTEAKEILSLVAQGHGLTTLPVRAALIVVGSSAPAIASTLEKVPTVRLPKKKSNPPPYVAKWKKEPEWIDFQSRFTLLADRLRSAKAAGQETQSLEIELKSRSEELSKLRETLRAKSGEGFLASKQASPE